MDDQKSKVSAQPFEEILYDLKRSLVKLDRKEYEIPLEAQFDTLEKGMEKLKEYIGFRDRLDNALCWTFMNRDCNAIASKLKRMGVAEDVLIDMLCQRGER